jgi:type IV secretory pathway protease TraF
MKKSLARCLCIAALGAAQGAAAATYTVAQSKFREADMVFVMVPSDFFGLAAEAKGRLFNAIRACARTARLPGDVVLVASDRGRLRTYADARFSKFLQPLDWTWLRPRLKQKLTCRDA